MVKLEHAKERTGREQKRERTKLRRELAQALREKDRTKLRELRDAIKRAKAERRARMAQTVERCKAERVAVRRRAAGRRLEVLEQLRDELEADRANARLTCGSVKARVRAEGANDIEAARGVLEAERHFQAEMRAAEGRHKARSEKHRASAAERREESDAEVIVNIPDEFVSVFRKVRKTIHGTKRMSRSEAFLHWAEEHPEDVVAVQSGEAERQVRELVSQYEAHHKKSRHPKRYKRAHHELAAELAAVPF